MTKETKKNWRLKYERMEGALVDVTSPFSDVIRSSSPSANFIYGNTWGLPRGYSEVLYGIPKSGKSLFARMKIGQLHQDNPEAIAVVFDTEFRWRGQLNAESASAYGIDLDRLWVFEGNSPMLIFDRIEKDLSAMSQDGCPIYYIIIDSITGIMGKREMNAESVEVTQIGDNALTIQTGLKRILGPIRKNKFACTLITQARAELDQWEIKKGNKIKMQASFGLQHFAEWFIMVSPNSSKEGRTDLLGNEFINDEVTDLMDKGENTGHKIRVVVKDASMGPKGRTGEFTLDRKRGVINQHEEVLRLGINRGVIAQAGAWLTFDGVRYQGKREFLSALIQQKGLQEEVIRQLMERDKRGEFAAMDKADEEANATELFLDKEETLTETAETTYEEPL